jgi:hypothetical protein
MIKLVRSLKKLLKKFGTTHKITRRFIIMIDQGWDYHKKNPLSFLPTNYYVLSPLMASYPKWGVFQGKLSSLGNMV